MAGLTKLKIIAYKTDDFGTKAGVGNFTAQINPEKWTEEFGVKYTASTTQGGAATQLRFAHVEQGKLSIDLYFDSTGLISTTPKNQKSKTVYQQIEDLKKLTLDMNSTEHQPIYIRLLWGTFQFDGLMTNMVVEYTLIDPQGNPIRAKATCSFETSTSLEKANKDAGLESPDMTHNVKVVAGDSLPNLANSIYDDPKYYIQVAEFNGLDQFRSLDIGTNLQFPPLSK